MPTYAWAIGKTLFGKAFLSKPKTNLSQQSEINDLPQNSNDNKKLRDRYLSALKDGGIWLS